MTLLYATNTSMTMVNILGGYDTSKLGQTNYLLVSKKVSGFWKININTVFTTVWKVIRIS